MNIRYTVHLSEEEIDFLKQTISRGTANGRRLKRAQILLAADQGISDSQISLSTGASTSMVLRTKQRCVEGGVEYSLSEAPRRGAPRRLSMRAEAALIATACSTAPEGRSRWTCQLLADEVVRLEYVESVSRETVRRRLAEKSLKPWLEQMWCVPTVDAEYVAKMEEILDLYAEPPDPSLPLVCFDETTVQLIDHARSPDPPRPGRAKRVDYEYIRNGVAHLLIGYCHTDGWRAVQVRDSHSKRDFAEYMRFLAEDAYPDATRIRVVLDNLSTHTKGALYQAFPPETARSVAQKIELHHTPKHASWLNMAEIEIGILKRQCLERRIGDIPTLSKEIEAWQSTRNAQKERIKWLFTVEEARAKFSGSYPEL